MYRGTIKGISFSCTKEHKSNHLVMTEVSMAFVGTDLSARVSNTPYSKEPCTYMVQLGHTVKANVRTI